MLPFLKKAKEAGASSGLLVKTRTPDAKPEQDEDDSSAAIHACAQALINAVHTNNVKATADALADAFEILSSKEDEPKAEPHSYDAQNAAAHGED